MTYVLDSAIRFGLRPRREGHVRLRGHGRRAPPPAPLDRRHAAPRRHVRPRYGPAASDPFGRAASGQRADPSGHPAGRSVACAPRRGRSLRRARDLLAAAGPGRSRESRRRAAREHAHPRRALAISMASEDAPAPLPARRGLPAAPGLLLFAWIVGSAAVGLRLFVGWSRVRRIGREARPIRDVEWLLERDAAARRLELSRRVDLVESEAVPVAMTFGHPAAAS